MDFNRQKAPDKNFIYAFGIPSLEDFGKMVGLGGGAEAGKEGVDAHLDKTKAALTQLKDTIKQNQYSEVWMESLKTATMKDLEEIGITGDKAKEYWEKKFQPEFQRSINGELELVKKKSVEDTPEFKDLEAYTNNLENMSGLKAIIDAKDPKAKAKSWLDSIKSNPTLVGAITIGAEMFLGCKEKDEKGELTSWGKLKLWLVGPPKDEKKDKPGETPPAEQTKEQKEAAEKLVAEHKGKITAEFANLKLASLDPASLDDGLKALNDAGVTEPKDQLELVKKAPNGNLSKVLQTVIDTYKNKGIEFKLQLADVLFERGKAAELPKENLDKILAAVKKFAESKEGKDQTKIRAFLTDLRNKRTDDAALKALAEKAPEKTATT